MKNDVWNIKRYENSDYKTYRMSGTVVVPLENGFAECLAWI